MKHSLVLLLALMFLTAAVTVTAEEPPTPVKLEGVRIIDSDEMKSLLGQKDVFVYDMRKALNFGKGHVPGAVSLPFKWLSEGDPVSRKGEFDQSRLPQDKNAKIVFHSDGPNGWKSYHAARMTKAAGYKNVLWYRIGFDDWTKKKHPVEH